MKYTLKYIILILSLICFVNLTFAQKKKKQHTHISDKARKSTTNQKGKKKSLQVSKGNKKIKIEKFDEAANLNSLLKNTNVETRANKSDSIPDKVVTIMSAFKPQLKNVAKISFTNASSQTDTTSLNLNYQVPSQNLSFQYRPISLIPRSYKTDSLQLLNNVTSIKIGYGNYFHQYLGINFNTKDAYKNTHSFELINESVSGLHHLQTIRDLGFNYVGDIFINDNNHLATQVFYNQSERYRYGLVPDASTYPYANFKQNYFHSGIALGWINYSTKPSLIHYKPTLKIERFEGQGGSTNNWLYFKDPMYIQLKEDIKFNFDFSYSYSQYKAIVTPSQTNTELRLDPSISFNKLNSEFVLGVSPTKENSEFNLYPLIEFKRKLKDTNYLLTAGWHTHAINNQYASLVSMNPWIKAPSSIEMTTQDQKYIDIQISAGKRLNYGFTISLNDYKNLPLFNKVLNNNNAITGLFYNTIFEKKATTIEFDAHLSYQFSDELMLINKLKYIQFNTLEENAKPWGILPLTLNSTLSWMPNNKWIIDGGLQYWSGATLFNESNLPYNLKNSLVLNAGFTYKIAPKWNAWVKGENLLDKPYERWADYPSLGVQLIAGVVYSFRK